MPPAAGIVRADWAARSGTGGWSTSQAMVRTSETQPAMATAGLPLEVAPALVTTIVAGFVRES